MLPEEWKLPIRVPAQRRNFISHMLPHVATQRVQLPIGLRLLHALRAIAVPLHLSDVDDLTRMISVMRANPGDC